ncbi:putative non-specific serine/threonine protein kinase [Helianthus anomalus]
MGANAAGDQLDQTIVLINLVPLKQNFNFSTSYSIYQKFWRKQVSISKARFGSYQVVHVQFPGITWVIKR